MTDPRTIAWDWVTAWAREQEDALGRLLIVHPEAFSDVRTLLATYPEALALQPFRPDFRLLEASAPGRVLSEIPDGPFDTILFVPTRQRSESLGLIQRAIERLTPTGRLIFACANDQGAPGFLSRLRELIPGLPAQSKHRCRLAVIRREAIVDPSPLRLWEKAAGAMNVEGTAFRSMPGIFGWAKVDRGSELLVSTLPALAGRGADLGAGYGYLSQAALTRWAPSIDEIHAVEADARALTCARENLSAWPQARFHWLDVVGESLGPLAVCDWVLMNPPFHEGKQADPSLGNDFIEAAAGCLKPQGGMLYMVANGFLAYEDTLEKHFTRIDRVLATSGFKVLHARR